MIGTYHPSSEDSAHGVLVTRDNLEFSALVKGSALKKLLADPTLLQTPKPQNWYVYPRTLPVLQFALVRLISLPSDLNLLDEFKITGEVVAQLNETTIIRIYRSRSTTQASGQSIPSFTLKLSGVLLESQIGQFWRINAFRNGKKLEIGQAELIEAETRSASTTENTPNSRFFHVRVGKQTFIGKHNVRLKAKMLYIDDRPITQTEQAIVKGHLSLVDADSITVSQNELILTSH